MKLIAYVGHVFFHVVLWITRVTDKQWILSHHQHLSKHTMVDGGVLNVVNNDNMAPTDDKTLPIHSWLIQGLTNTTAVVNYCSTVKLYVSCYI